MARTVYALQVTIIDGLMTEEFVRANPVVSRTIEILKPDAEPTPPSDLRGV